MAINDVESMPVSSQAVFSAVLAGLTQLRWTIVTADPAASFVQASTRMGLASWGENITVRVLATGPNTSTLHTTVALKFGLVDWGKRRKRVAELKSAVRNALAVPTTTMSPAGWYPDPWGVARRRWFDGANWTASTD